MSQDQLRQAAQAALDWLDCKYPETMTAKRSYAVSEELRAALADPQHADDFAVDRFADAMKAKLAKQRAKGYAGWNDPAACSTSMIQESLASHVSKGDPVDVGNFAMMLFCRGEKANAPEDAKDAAQADQHLTALLRYTENFYGAAIEHGMKRGETANAIAHIEKSAKALHAYARDAARLQDVINGIYIYANDTLSGRVDGVPADRDWYRTGIVEIRNRARTPATTDGAIKAREFIKGHDDE